MKTTPTQQRTMKMALAAAKGLSISDFPPEVKNQIRGLIEGLDQVTRISAKSLREYMDKRAKVSSTGRPQKRCGPNG